MALITLKLDKEIIASRLFKDSHLLIPGYVEGLKQDIIEEHEEIIYLTKRKPHFDIIPFLNTTLKE